MAHGTGRKIGFAPISCRPPKSLCKPLLELARNGPRFSVPIGLGQLPAAPCGEALQSLPVKFIDQIRFWIVRQVERRIPLQLGNGAGENSFNFVLLIVCFDQVPNNPARQ